MHIYLILNQTSRTVLSTGWILEELVSIVCPGLRRTIRWVQYAVLQEMNVFQVVNQWLSNEQDNFLSYLFTNINSWRNAQFKRKKQKIEKSRKIEILGKRKRIADEECFWMHECNLKQAPKTLNPKHSTIYVL